MSLSDVAAGVGGGWVVMVTMAGGGGCDECQNEPLFGEEDGEAVAELSEYRSNRHEVPR